MSKPNRKEYGFRIDMSGGSFGYMYSDIKDTYVGRMEDGVMDELMRDLCDVLHALEWWQSDDWGESSYRDVVKEFKKKWFQNYDVVLAEVIAKVRDDAIKKLKEVSE